MSVKTIPHIGIILGPEPGKEVCDFCSNSHPQFTIPCETFQSSVGGSIGDWAACDTCAELIAGEKWDDLKQRSIESAFPDDPELWATPEIRGFVDTLHKAFRANRKYKQMGSGMYIHSIPSTNKGASHDHSTEAN